MKRPTRRVYLANLKAYLRAHAGEDELWSEGLPVSSKAVWLLEYWALVAPPRKRKTERTASREF